MIIGVPKEIDPAETRAAMVPANVAKLISLGAEVRIESGAGLGSSIEDQNFEEAGAKLVKDRADLLMAADIVLRVRKPRVFAVKLLPLIKIEFQLVEFAHLPFKLFALASECELRVPPRELPVMQARFEVDPTAGILGNGHAVVDGVRRPGRYKTDVSK